MRTVVQILLVAGGSAVGGLARWGVALAFGRLLGAAYPWATLAINVTGSLFLGWFMTVLDKQLVVPDPTRADDLRLLVAVGFTGAYTTFSTFEYETHRLLRAGDGLAAAAYVAGSVFLGLLAVRLGVHLARPG